MKLILFFLSLFSFSLAKSQSGIITYDRVRIVDSSNANLSFHFNVNLPEEEKRRLAKDVYGRRCWKRYLYFTPNTTWCYKIAVSGLEKTKASAVDVVRSYKDSTHKHLQLMDVSEDGFGGQNFTAVIKNMPTHLRRAEISTLKGYRKGEESCEILGYTCYAYKNPKEPEKIYWVTEELDLPSLGGSSFLHPESTVSGVVLKYEYAKGYMEAVSIDFCILNEIALRHTPLLELRPEMVRQ